ncbi:hypothetical protein [Nocardia terpenica]|uniref:Uncharacterized protein n=1 Tax=Nocardia terpenica TaxID=455432 RepID=A0A6G9ZBN6_9NOCA|nr:hypothetical protein [Nocardia terpenica]QIS22566.1 hypothetical protein F6W96_33770 [Nocardia terpenica]
MAGEAPEPTARYLYERLGKERFQQLCAALLKLAYPNATCYPIGEADGGRDIAVDGKAIIYQVKWAKRQPPNPATWLNKTINGEAESIRALVVAGAREYILLTSVSGTGPPDTGSMDRVNELLRAHSARFGIPMRCEWRACLDAWVEVAPAELKWTYPEMLAGTEAVRYVNESGRDRIPEVARSLLDRLAVSLRDRTCCCLTDSDGSLKIDRKAAKAALSSAFREVASVGGALIVLGDPDVGKSALALEVAADLPANGGRVTTISLYDLPNTMFEFETALHTTFSDILAGTGTELTLVDGAEAVLEGRFDLLAQLAAAALRVGVGVVAVTRTDAAGAVSESLTEALRAVGAPARLREHEVPPLEADELELVTARFPSLRTLARNSRPGWVIGRPGLLNMLLRSSGATDLPDQAISEADVFQAIWCGVVRRPTSSARDAREYALIMLARRHLLPDTPPMSALEAAALPSLRSDGLLLAAEAGSMWACGPEFAGDLPRDFAVATLLLRDGWSILRTAAAPRWTLRATRLACQTRLGARPDLESEYARILDFFHNLAREFGHRWSEVPLEAVLTAGDAPRLLEPIWPHSTEREQGDLIRLALDRHAADGVGDTAILSPLVDLAYVRIEPEDRTWFPDNRLERLVLAWLRGLLRERSDSNSLRARVRDTTLATTWRDTQDFPVEVIALLGPDLDERAASFLRGCPDKTFFGVQAVVESHWPVASLAEHHPVLLADLTEATYARRTQGVFHNPRKSHSTTDFTRGPFAALLDADPTIGIRIAQSVLNHVARSDAASKTAHYGGQPPGVELEFPDGTRHFCFGSSSDWNLHWGIGRLDEHLPTASAAQAVRRYAERLIESGAMPLAQIVAALLDNCRNIVMPALVTTLLIEYLDRVEDELDCWLKQPEIWELEQDSSRLSWMAPKTEAVQALVRQRLACSLPRAARTLVIAALFGESDECLTLLRDLGVELRRRSERRGDDGVEFGRRCAELLDGDNYRLHLQDGLIIGVDQPPPASDSVDEPLELDADRKRLRTIREISTRYRFFDEIKLEQIASDLKTIRAVEYSSMGDSRRELEDAIEGVALAAVIAHAEGSIRFDRNETQWAAKRLIDKSFRRPDDFDPELSLYGMAGNPSTSRGLLSLLLPCFSGAAIEYTEVSAALLRSTDALLSKFDDALESGNAELWSAPCHLSATDTCEHAIAWQAVERWIRRRATRGAGSQIEVDEDSVIELLTHRAGFDTRDLAGPIIACHEAANSRCCVAERASATLDAMLAADRRVKTTDPRAYLSRPEDAFSKAVPKVLAANATQGRFQPLRQHLEALIDSPNALAELLYGLAWQATHDAEVRRALPRFWPEVMAVVLDSGRDSSLLKDGIALLLPAPTTTDSDNPTVDMDIGFLRPPGWQHPDAILAAAGREWISPTHLGPLMERWLHLARGNGRAIDRLVRFARTTDMSWQATTGLHWMEALVAYDKFPFTRHLSMWLKDIRATVESTSASMPVFLRLVDALAADGDEHAVSIQLEAE